MDLEIIERLPQRLREDPRTREISEVMRSLAAALFEASLATPGEFSAKTATWGLPAWEALVGITPEPGSSEESRRLAVIAKLTSAGTANAERIRAMAEALTGYSAGVTENFSEYSFSLRFYGPEAGFIRVDLSALDAAVEEIKPAHLRLVVEPITWGDLERANMTWEQLEAEFPSWGDLENARYCHGPDE